MHPGEPRPLGRGLRETGAAASRAGVLFHSISRSSSHPTRPGVNAPHSLGDAASRSRHWAFECGADVLRSPLVLGTLEPREPLTSEMAFPGPSGVRCPWLSCAESAPDTQTPRRRWTTRYPRSEPGSTGLVLTCTEGMDAAGVLPSGQMRVREPGGVVVRPVRGRASAARRRSGWASGWPGRLSADLDDGQDGRRPRERARRQR